MKILHIITRLVQGGAQQNTIMCCAAQVAAGHEVYLAFGPIYGPEGSMLPQAQASGAQLREVPAMVRQVSLGRDRRAGQQLRELIREIQPDVVHTHSSKAGILGRHAAWALRVPAVIHTIHGLPFHPRQSYTLNTLYALVERRAARRCHKLVGITQAMIDAFRKRRIGRPEQYEVVPSGIELADFEMSADRAAALREQVREAREIPLDAPVVGIVARLDKLKGHDDFLNILPRLKRAHPKLQALIVGDGALRKHLEERISFASLRQYVHMIGLVPPQQVQRYLAAMDVMVLPSYQEGQGRTLVEALLAGCGIVGYNVGGIGEVCIDQVTGRLVKAGRQTRLMQAVDWMLQDPQRRAGLVDAGRKHVREHFSAALMYQQLEEIYSQVLNQQKQEV